jgi:hypothetical protein
VARRRRLGAGRRELRGRPAGRLTTPWRERWPERPVRGDVRFVGAVVSYRIDLGDRQLTVTRPPQAEILAEGEPVTVTWSPHDSILLPPDDERTP